MSQGELIGVLNLGPRRSERPYNLDDRRLLDNLAGKRGGGHPGRAPRSASSATGATARTIDNELKVAQLMKQFLPGGTGTEGWTVSPHYRPREVGGDFYDFIPLPEGRIGLVVGDVTDKGVPAAMVMATTHSILRSDAPRLVDPAPSSAGRTSSCARRMPRTCSSPASTRCLDPATGHIRFANAGHNLPCIHTVAGVVEPRAPCMPLGLMPGLTYDEQEITIARGARCCSMAGVVEAHK